MSGSKSIRCERAAFHAALVTTALLASSGVAAAQGIQDIVTRICTAPSVGSVGGVGASDGPPQIGRRGPVIRPAAVGTPPASLCNGLLTPGSVASITPSQFNSVDFLGGTTGNSEFDAVSQRLAKRRKQDQQSQAATPVQYASADPSLDAAAPSDDIVVGPFSFYVAARGGVFDRDDTTTQRGFSGDTVGGRIGGDFRATESLILGAYFGYDRVAADYTAGAGNTRTDNYSGVLYGSYNATDRLYLEGAAGYVHNDYATTRNGIMQVGTAGVPAQAFTASGNSHGGQWLGTIGAGYEYPMGATTLTPYGRMSYVQTSIKSYTETSTSFLANQVNGVTTTSLTSSLGVRVSHGHAIGMSWGVLVPQIRGEYIHEFDGARSSASSFVNDPSHAALLINDPVAHDYGKVGLTLTAVLPHGLLPYLDYEALVGDQHYAQHLFTAGLRVEF